MSTAAPAIGLTGREEAWRFTPLKTFGPLLAHAITPEDFDDSVPQPDIVTTIVDRNADVEVIDLVDGENRTIEISESGEIAYRAIHCRVPANASAKATFVFTGTGTCAVHLVTTVESGARLVVNSLQEWSAGAIHLMRHDVLPGRDASIRVGAVTLGGDAVRIDTRVHFDEPGASVELFGLSFGSEQQFQEHRSTVNHNAAHCSSSVVHKTVADGHAHQVWVGDIVIRASGTGADSYELNRNLLLSETARADSVPNLELETGDVVGAGHASATGRFDDEQIFYLQSRGIPPSQARRMVVEGFFAELLDSMELGETADRLLADVHRRLGDDA